MSNKYEPLITDFYLLVKGKDSLPDRVIREFEMEDHPYTKRRFGIYVIETGRHYVERKYENII